MWFQAPNALSAGMIFNQYQIQTGDTDNNMMFIRDWVDPQLGMHHYKYKQTYKNVPVEGTGLIEHYHPNNGLIFSNGKLAIELDLNVKAELTEEEALQELLISFDSETVFAWENADWELDYQQNTNNPNATNYPTGELVLALDNYNNIDYLIAGNRYTLAYKFEIITLAPRSHKYYWVDANTGSLIKNVQAEHNDGAATIERKSNQGNLTQTIDTRQRGFINGNDWVLETDNANVQVHTKYYDFASWITRPEIDDGNDTWTGTEVHATTGHYYTHRTWEYFRDIWQLDGVDDNNENVRVEVHSNLTGNNASSARQNGLRWLRFTFNNNISMSRYCDVVSHEYVHGIIHHSSELIYQGESGALNESFADIFGLMAQRSILGNNSVSNWLLGGDPGLTGVPTRSFINPSSEGSHNFANGIFCGVGAGQPDTYLGLRWTDVNLACDNGGVHGNSGVQNHWFYLLSVGGTGINDNNDAFAVQGIGRDDAAEIAFWSMQNELIDVSDYDDARIGAVTAAILLFGNCSIQHTQTENAWQAVGVGNASDCGNLYVESKDVTDFSIYPNPSNGLIKLNWKNASTYNITVFDLSGRIVFSEANVNNNMTFNVQLIPAGAYIIEARNGETTVRKKVIKY
ncbi:M4 family metallopeptidase [Putridiphycobacter roseus]|nr:M4 family metallopeptidase [Putridiphycobacter roseus]